MNNTNDKHPIEPLIADYLNGHLSAAEANTVEQALNRDQVLREALEFERQLQQAVRDPALESAKLGGSMPQFSSIAERLEPKSKPRAAWFDWLTWGVPAAAAVLLVVSFLGQQPADTGVSDYELLSDPTTAFTEPMLRVIAQSGTQAETFDALVSDYDLTVVDRHPGVFAIDVKVPPTVSMEQVRLRMASDQRIRFVQQLGKK